MPQYEIGDKITARDLKDKYDKDLKELQDNCRHLEIESMLHEWAPGHISGRVNVCKTCWKIID